MRVGRMGLRAGGVDGVLADEAGVGLDKKDAGVFRLSINGRTTERRDMPRVAAPRRVSPSEAVLDALSRRIEDGTWAIGSCLPAERQMAAELGVSRVVVREAAKKLEQRGLVVIRQGIGVEVVNNPALPVQRVIERLLPQDRERLRQAAEARLLIEPELAAAAARRLTPARLARLRRLTALLGPGTERARAVDGDMAFHEAIAEMAENKVLALMLRSVSELGRLARHVTMEQFGVARAYEQHVAIVAGIAAGEGAARAAMRAHLEAALADLGADPAPRRGG